MNNVLKIILSSLVVLFAFCGCKKSDVDSDSPKYFSITVNSSVEKGTKSITPEGDFSDTYILDHIYIWIQGATGTTSSSNSDGWGKLRLPCSEGAFTITVKDNGNNTYTIQSDDGSLTFTTANSVKFSSSNSNTITLPFNSPAYNSPGGLPTRGQVADEYHVYTGTVFKLDLTNHSFTYSTGIGVNKKTFDVKDGITLTRQISAINLNLVIVKIVTGQSTTVLTPGDFEATVGLPHTDFRIRPYLTGMSSTFTVGNTYGTNPDTFGLVPIDLPISPDIPVDDGSGKHYTGIGIFSSNYYMCLPTLDFYVKCVFKVPGYRVIATLESPNKLQIGKPLVLTFLLDVNMLSEAPWEDAANTRSTEEKIVEITPSVVIANGEVVYRKD